MAQLTHRGTRRRDCQRCSEQRKRSLEIPVRGRAALGLGGYRRPARGVGRRGHARDLAPDRSSSFATPACSRSCRCIWPHWPYQRSWTGDLAGVASLIAEAESVAAATGTAFAPFTLMRLRALQGREAEASALISRTIEQQLGGQGIAATNAYWAAAVLYNGLARYEEARVCGPASHLEYVRAVGIHVRAPGAGRGGRARGETRAGTRGARAAGGDDTSPPAPIGRWASRRAAARC